MALFADVDKLIDHLREESGHAERFVTRFILLEGVDAWEKLISRLLYEVDGVVYLSEFCEDDDVFPDARRLIAYLKEQARYKRSLLICPLSEWVRLDPKKTDLIQLLAEWETACVSSGLQRIYVPLLNFKSSFYQTMNSLVRYQSHNLPEEWSLEYEGTCDVVIAPFLGDVGNRKVASGIREYLSFWEKGTVRNGWLQTELAPWLPKEYVRGKFTVRTYADCFEYLAEVLHCSQLTRQWGTPEQWEWLATQVRKEESLDEVCGRLLNVTQYNANRLFPLWLELDKQHQWLVWLWSKCRPGTDSYLSHVLERNKNFEDFAQDTAITAFNMQMNPTYSQERKQLLQRIGLRTMPLAFWESYRMVNDPSVRVAILTDISEEERKEIIMCVSQLLEEDPYGSWWDYLEVAFPALVWYLRLPVLKDEFVDRYFSVYKYCRIKDSADKQLQNLTYEWAEQQYLWNYPTRAEILTELRDGGAKIYWVDAMGLEWAGLLTRLLEEKNEVECEVRIARSNLPTTTDVNQAWHEGETVERGLDDIAHHYAYSFPESFLRSMEVIERVAERVMSLLYQTELVVITSDHGLSRFAAKSDVRIDVPEDANPVPPGRYATLKESTYQDLLNGQHEDILIRDGNNLFLMTHARLRVAGNFFGEVHGGATPEEVLVPVIVVRRRSLEIKCEVVDNVVRLNPKGEGTLKVRSNTSLSNLYLFLHGSMIMGRSENGKEWVFSLVNLSQAQIEHTGELYYNSRPIGKVQFKTVRGITAKDLGI